MDCSLFLLKIPASKDDVENGPRGEPRRTPFASVSQPEAAATLQSTSIIDARAQLISRSIRIFIVALLNCYCTHLDHCHCHSPYLSDQPAAPCAPLLHSAAMAAAPTQTQQVRIDGHAIGGDG